jgi:hypothetical protein
MSVSAQIAQHMFRTAKRWLGIDDPVLAEEYSQPCGEGARLGKMQQVAAEPERALLESVAKSGDELSPAVKHL